ncbi:MAG: histidine phosphatase family protein [Phycisphaeraceae bacterium]|nr:histidine phosphatase family protein [Phycisphaeraceae bacterium]
MSEFPSVVLARHGETEWSKSGKHTGLTDLPLTPQGEAAARAIGERLQGQRFDRVFVSPLQRAFKTCKLAGFGGMAEVNHDLVEWDYGNYEGLTSAQIRQQNPDWNLFRDGCPGGESPSAIAARADRVVAKTRKIGGRVLLFSSGHFLRALASRWLQVPIYPGGGHLLLGTASVSILSYEHNLQEPAISLWNDRHHVPK